MEPSFSNIVGLAALVVIVLWLGRRVHSRSESQQPIHGGAASKSFNFLSSLCFAAILPTVLMTVIVFHPDVVKVAGIVWHPLILAVLALGLGSYGFALLHAIAERGSLDRTLQQIGAQEERGWTEEDARSSGL